ncbi:unnamed protein product [Acanthoscelides obtectus]|uniref:Uncharacterized protein n=1 Tax=Acanthoscelides obtectus TaxID=200917 RepID=A0A9P0L0X3_ACAOB|nr:unnamed protein product [Acanthoscelides obtectus]CAK1623391.1 hypothetical protein AOBTE_LOCUS1977 [Acanthoscelides obtectus]
MYVYELLHIHDSKGTVANYDLDKDLDEEHSTLAEGSAFLVTIINAMLRTQYFPARWMTTEDIMVPRWDRYSLKITAFVCSSPSKLAEKVIYRHLENFSSAHHMIPVVQFSFRSEHSTGLQAFRLVEHVTREFTLSMSSGILLLDVS